MTGVVKVSGRVFVPGRVTAADVPAGHAQTQVHPGIANLQAVFAAFSTRRDVANLIQMRADSIH